MSEYDAPAETHEEYEQPQYDAGHEPELYAQPSELVGLIGGDLNEAAFDLNEPHEVPVEYDAHAGDPEYTGGDQPDPYAGKEYEGPAAHEGDPGYTGEEQPEPYAGKEYEGAEAPIYTGGEIGTAGQR